MRNFGRPRLRGGTRPAVVGLGSAGGLATQIRDAQVNVLHAGATVFSSDPNNLAVRLGAVYSIGSLVGRGSCGKFYVRPNDNLGSVCVPSHGSWHDFICRIVARPLER